MIQKDITNYKFNKLIAVEFYKKDKFGKLYWLFKCDCGNKKVINKSRVMTNQTKSCGCLEKEFKFKPLFNLLKPYRSEYTTWFAMKQRCLNTENKDYLHYGGRGIKICDRWMKFENFFNDMGKRPKGKTIDRIDNNGNYELSNCRWATPKEQISNTRRVIYINFNGKIMIAKEWANLFSLDYRSFIYHFKKNNNMEFALIKAKKKPVSLL